jgi:hypothetical protein
MLRFDRLGKNIGSRKRPHGITELKTGKMPVLNQLNFLPTVIPAAAFNIVDITRHTAGNILRSRIDRRNKHIARFGAVALPDNSPLFQQIDQPRRTGITHAQPPLQE